MRSWVPTVAWSSLGIFALVVAARVLIDGWGSVGSAAAYAAAVAAISGGVHWARLWLAPRLFVSAGLETWSTRRLVALAAAGVAVGVLLTVLGRGGLFPGRQNLMTNFRLSGGVLLAFAILMFAMLIRNWGWRAVLRDLLGIEEIGPPSESSLPRPLDLESPALLIGVMAGAGLALISSAWILFKHPSLPGDGVSLPRTLNVVGAVFFGLAFGVWWKARRFDRRSATPARSIR
jgi:hypothetical protein